nr:small integral membrane protein 3 isoform X1 [Taeniopygia guttata]
MRRSVFLFFPANRPAVLCVSFLPLPPIPFPSFSSPAVPRGPGGARRSLFLPAGSPGRSWSRSGFGVGAGAWQRRRMDLPHLTSPTDLPKHILDIWVIVLIILATILIMTVLVLCPATAVIIYRVRTHPTRNSIVQAARSGNV